MVFTENLIGIFNSIVEIRKNSKFPGFIKRLYTNYYIRKATKEYDKSMRNIQLNYDIIHDFVRFYLNSIDMVNKYFMYKLLKKGFSNVSVGKDFAKFTMTIHDIRYDITFRSDSEIEINKFEKDKHKEGSNVSSLNMIYINYGYFEDKELDSMIKKEIIQYISYYLRSSVFID